MTHTHTKNPAAVALGSIRSARKAASSRANGAIGVHRGNPYVIHAKPLYGAAVAVLRDHGPAAGRHDPECECTWCRLRGVVDAIGITIVAENNND